MKKLSLFLFLSAIILFTSCEKDSNDSQDNSIETSEETIIGTWDLTELITKDAVLIIEEINEESKFTGIAKDLDVSMIFSDNPKELKTEGTFHYTITYDDGYVLKEERDFDFFDHSDGWKIENNSTELYNHSKGSSVVGSSAIILEMTETTLKLEMFYSKFYDTTENERSTFIATFTKKQ